MSSAAIRLADGVWRVPTLGANLINSYLLEEPDGSLTLVDAGLKRAPRRLVGALSQLGKRPQDVGRILLTHAHSDHVGGASAMRTRTGAAVQSHTDDAEYVRNGRRPPLDRSVRLARVFAHVGTRLSPCEIDGTFKDGDVLDVARGLSVLHTPGHSPGHCSFLHRASGVLITGDAMFNFRHKMSYSYAVTCSNFKLSQDTADRLGEPDYEVAAFTHGPEITTGAREAVRGFLSKRRKE
jgi:glyoxylase-like metal-dependent hydrolase (beta-lactamase superfamily II)